MWNIIFYLVIFDLTGSLSPHMSSCFFSFIDKKTNFYFVNFRRTGVANTLRMFIIIFRCFILRNNLDIAIEKCYEQLNYIRDSYAEVSINNDFNEVLN